MLTGQIADSCVLDRAYRRRSDGKSRAAREVEHETLTGVALMNAFLGLFLSAVQYSLLAGENGCASPAAGLRRRNC
jgi:hypothetical protein